MISSETLTLLTRLLQIDSVESPALEGMPFGKGNAEALALVLDTMRQWGFDTVNLDNFCGYAEIGKGDLFGILCHLDVVPVTDGWSHPPFGAERVGNRIYARGAMDDKGPAIAAMTAAKQLLDQGLTPTKRIRFLFGCDEESGWKCMERYAATEEMPAMGFSPDADFPVINCEKGIVYHTLTMPRPAGVVSLNAGTRANVVPDAATLIVKESLCPHMSDFRPVGDGTCRLQTTGVSSHAATPEQGKNALTALLNLARDVDPLFATLADAFGQTDGSGVSLALHDAKSGALTLNLGTAETDGDVIRMQLDVRHPVTMTKEDVTRILKERLSPAIEVEQGFYHLPLYVSPDHPLVKTLLDAYNEVMHTDARPITIGGGTYARMLPLGVAFGPCFPGKPSTIHQIDEYIDLDDFERMTEIYRLALERLCFR